MANPSPYPVQKRCTFAVRVAFGHPTLCGQRSGRSLRISDPSPSCLGSHFQTARHAISNPCTAARVAKAQPQNRPGPQGQGLRPGAEPHGPAVRRAAPPRGAVERNGDRRNPDAPPGLARGSGRRFLKKKLLLRVRLEVFGNGKRVVRMKDGNSEGSGHGSNPMNPRCIFRRVVIRGSVSCPRSLIEWGGDYPLENQHPLISHPPTNPTTTPPKKKWQKSDKKGFCWATYGIHQPCGWGPMDGGGGGSGAQAQPPRSGVTLASNQSSQQRRTARTPHRSAASQSTSHTRSCPSGPLERTAAPTAASWARAAVGQTSAGAGGGSDTNCVAYQTLGGGVAFHFQKTSQSPFNTQSPTSYPRERGGGRTHQG